MSWDGRPVSTGWTAWTPVWSISAGTLVVGNSTLTGGYRIGSDRAVQFWARLSVGSTASSPGGTGIFALTLPVKPATGMNLSWFPLGRASLRAGTTVRIWTPIYPGSSTTVMQIADDSGALWTPTTFGPVSGMNVLVTGSYEGSAP